MQTQSLFSRLKDALVPLAAIGSRPTLSEVETAVRLRSDLLSALGLPVTRHNTDRLVTWALVGLSLRSFIRDVDVFFPDPTLADEALFLSAFAAHCARRKRHSVKARRHECAALLRLDRASHGPLLDAVVAGLVTPGAARTLARAPGVAA